MRHPEEILEEIEKVQDWHKLELESSNMVGNKISTFKAIIVHESCCRAVNELVSELVGSLSNPLV